MSPLLKETSLIILITQQTESWYVLYAKKHANNLQVNLENGTQETGTTEGYSCLSAHKDAQLEDISSQSWRQFV